VPVGDRPVFLFASYTPNPEHRASSDAPFALKLPVVPAIIYVSTVLQWDEPFTSLDLSTWFPTAQPYLIFSFGCFSVDSLVTRPPTFSPKFLRMILF